MHEKNFNLICSVALAHRSQDVISRFVISKPTIRNPRHATSENFNGQTLELIGLMIESVVNPFQYGRAT